MYVSFLILQSLNAEHLRVLGSKEQGPKAQATGAEGVLGRKRSLGTGMGREGFLKPNLYCTVH